VYFEVDPRDPHNAAVFDLDKALRNRAGKVEFSADMVILRPVDRSKANGRLFFEVNNRGNKIAPTMLNSTPPTPTTQSDDGRGLRQRLAAAPGLHHCLGRVGRRHRAWQQPPDSELPDCDGEREADHRTHPD